VVYETNLQENNLQARARAWRENEAKQRENSKDWFAAAFHLTWLLKDDPTNAELYQRRGNAYAATGKHLEAEADFAHARKLRLQEKK
jgi:hypothetical protein